MGGGGGGGARLTPEFVGKSFLAGGVAGMCAKTTVAPLDRVKILLQAHNSLYRDLGVGASLARVVKQEGPRALFRGNGAQMARIFPYGALQFTAFEVFKQALPRLELRGLGAKDHAMKFVAGSLAGLIAGSLRHIPPGHHQGQARFPTGGGEQVPWYPAYRLHHSEE